MCPPARHPTTTRSTMGKQVKTFNKHFYSLFPCSMPCGSELEIVGCVYDDADQIRFDLQCHSSIKAHPHRVEKYRVIAMHLNPRFNERTTVLNSMVDSEWLDEIRNDHTVFAPGASFTVKIR